MMDDQNIKILEMLSAYLDGELSPQENESIQARIQADPQLRAALDKLRKTRNLLREVPIAKAPRNFTLTPEMVGQRTSFGRMFGVMRFVSAMAMIMFVAVVAGDLLTNGGQVPVFSRAMSASDSVEMGDVAVMEMAAEAPEAGMAEADEPMGVDLAEDTMDDGIVEDTSDQTSADEDEQTPRVSETSLAEESVAQEGEADALEGLSTTDATVTESIEQEDATPQVTEATETADTIGEQERASAPETAAGDAEKIGVEGDGVDNGAFEEPVRILQPNRRWVFRVIEAGLILLVIGTGMTALAIRKKRSGD